MNLSPLLDFHRMVVVLLAHWVFTVSAMGKTVWNINVGSATNQITPTDNFIGAATENSANSTWNHVSNINATTLVDSTGNNAAGVTFKITPIPTSAIDFGAQALTTGDKIFRTWIKDNGNNDLFDITFGNLKPSSTYSLIIYADWFWANGSGALPVTQTSGSGLSGTFHLNRDIASGVNGMVGALLEDTNAANVASGKTNYARFNGLIPSAGNTLSFSMGAVNGPVSGFQLVETSAVVQDTTPPSPNPMTWASAPAAAGSSSITMTATTSIDTSGVEYFFDETSGNAGGSDSGWQSSPTYTDSDLNPGTAYTYTVTARDRSTAQNTTAASAPASATTTAAPVFTVWNVQFASQAGNQITTADNFIGAAVENSVNSTWNRVASIPQTNMVLRKSTGENTTVSMDFSGGSIGTQNLTSGPKIFNSRVGGGSTSTLTLKGLSITNSYDMIFYSDWWWKNGDALPITQTKGTGLVGTFFVNRSFAPATGTVSALSRDVDPSNNTSTTGNWMRVNGVVPAIDGEMVFRLTDGNNTPFNGFQLIATPVAPKAEILAMTLPSNPTSLQQAVINGTNIALTVPFGTNVTSLAPVFSLWPGASCSIPSGTARNFSSPQTYTVVSSDSQVTNHYLVTVLVAPPLPEFTLSAPANWDGRSVINVEPVISNLAQLQANNGMNLSYQWTTSNIAVTQTTSPGIMTLSRSQGNGPLNVTLTVTNGTLPVTRSATISVKQPSSDPWLERLALPNEKPVSGQFFARNPFTNLGTIFYRGAQTGSPDDVFLKVYRTPSGGPEELYATHRQPISVGEYNFSATIEAGLYTYRVVYGTRTGGVDSDLASVGNLLCGDVFIINGQSNAQATANDEPQANVSNQWIKTYDASLGWGPAYAKPLSPQWGSKVGFWGMKLARDLVAQHEIPVCIINGAVGGTRIDQHQPNPSDRTVGAGTYDIYANLLNRVIAARLTHGVRAIFWHQGESDGSTFGPPLEPDYLSYEQNFLNMSAAWKQDFPNFRNYFFYQVAVNPCSIGPFASELREVQRNLPRMFSNMSIMHNHGLQGYDGCHYTTAGYESMATRLLPLVNEQLYGVVPVTTPTPPNLVQAWFKNASRTEVALQFDQTMSWNAVSLSNYFINNVGNLVTSGSVSGNTITLQLSSAAASESVISYVKDTWNYNEPFSTLLFGANGIPSLTFANVAIQSASPYQSWINSKNLTGVALAVDADPDQDGLKNLMEFVLGGEPNPSHPSANSSAVFPTSMRNASGDLVFAFRRKVDSIGNVNLSFQWSSDLVFSEQKSLMIGSIGSSSDGVAVAISRVDPATDEVVVTVPASKAMGDRLFGRLHATAP